MPEDRAQPELVQDARARPMRDDPEFRLKSVVVRPLKAERAGPALLQGGGVALMFGDPVGQS